MNTNKIPKKIHYIWFGDREKSPLILKCIESWKNVLINYEIIKWGNESIEKFSDAKYFRQAIKDKKWAFASDYARLKILYEEGGIYLDTDMFVLKSFDDFLNHKLVLGKEDDVHVSAGMIAAEKRNDFIKKCLDKYASLNEGEYMTIPRILSEVYKEEYKAKIFESKYFYPFTAENIYKFNFKNASSDSYAVHMWDYSWGSSYIKFLKKIKLHKLILKITENLGIKNFLKKITKTI